MGKTKGGTRFGRSYEAGNSRRQALPAAAGRGGRCTARALGDMARPGKARRIGRQDAQHRRQTVCADALARLMLAGPGATAPQALRFARSASGRPSCPVLPLSFSLSHSGGYAACAVSARPVGVDLEEIRPLRPALLGILSEEERAWMGDDAARFAQLWTAKEAMLKCRGAALGRLRHLPLAMTPDGPAAQRGALRLFLPARAGGDTPSRCAWRNKKSRAGRNRPGALKGENRPIPQSGGAQALLTLPGVSSGG